jgi:hypothetical protein
VNILLRVLRDYLELGRERDIYRDLILSIVPGLVALYMVYDLHVPIEEFVKNLTPIMNLIVTSFSILAGFNATSLSIFVTSNSPIVNKLREEEICGDTSIPGIKKIDQILAYFSWSVIVQLTLLFIAIIFTLVISYIKTITACWILWVVWITLSISLIGILYSVALTVRNFSILYMYLVAQSKE